jgi:hypothetical protein
MTNNNLSAGANQLAAMVARPDILFMDASIGAIDHARRARLSECYNILHYDCNSDSHFIAKLLPGGPYSNIIAIVRSGWLKAGPFAQHLPFAPRVVRYFPPSLRIICCSGHGYDAADVPALTAKGIVYCNTPNACTEAVANTAVSLVLDTFRMLTYAQWCARNDWDKSRELGLVAQDPGGEGAGNCGARGYWAGYCDEM